MSELDPPEAERTWYKNATTSELGYLVNRNGAELIKLNRESEEILLPWRAAEWIPDVDRRPLTGAALAQICHAADRELCRALGLTKEAKVEWASLKDTLRAQMIGGQPPGKPGIRAKVWTAIWDQLKAFAR